MLLRHKLVMGLMCIDFDFNVGGDIFRSRMGLDRWALCVGRKPNLNGLDVWGLVDPYVSHN